MNKRYVFRDGTIYLVCRPVKTLFRSNMIHDVITRGDYFAVNIETGDLTIIKGDANYARSNDENTI